MANLDQKYAFRDAITSGFRDHLLGPGSPDEILEVSPLDVYSIGMLHPLEQVSNEIQVDAIGIGGAESEEDEDYEYVQRPDRHASEEGFEDAGRCPMGSGKLA